MNLTLWITRLQTQVPELLLVEGAAEYAALAKQNMRPRKTPGAWVIPSSEIAQPNTLATLALSQRVELRVGIVLALRNLSDPRGEAAQSDLETVRESVLTALLNWQPDSSHDPVQLARGALLDFDDHVLWWQDEFTTAITRRVLS